MGVESRQRYHEKRPRSRGRSLVARSSVASLRDGCGSPSGLALFAALLAAGPGETKTAADWQPNAPLPQARTEVAAAAAGGEIVVVGGFLADGSTSARRGRVLTCARPLATPAGSPGSGQPRHGGERRAACLCGRRLRGRHGCRQRRARRVGAQQRPLADTPAPPGKACRRWSGDRGREAVRRGWRRSQRARAEDARPRPGQTAAGRRHRGRRPASISPSPPPTGRVYALGGRRAGLDTNLAALESYSPGARRWLELPPVPQPRGGTGAAAVGGRRIISVGGEEPDGTIGSVYAYDLAARRWTRLADLPTPRHGLGVVALGGRVYAIGGGPQPGLFVSDATESIAP